MSKSHRPISEKLDQAIADVKAMSNVYTVRIKADQSKMLNWEKPLAEQTPAIQDFFRKEGIPFEQD